MISLGFFKKQNVAYSLLFFVLCDKILDIFCLEVLVGQNEHPEGIILHFRD